VGAAAETASSTGSLARAMISTDERITVPKFMALKAAGEKITMLTAYDFSVARLLDEAGVESILVGDSLSMVVQGHDSTLRVTLDEIIYHARIVCRAVRRALVVVDLPFPLCHLGPMAAIESGARILKETGCQAVKLEGGAAQAETISALVGAGIPVVAHCGLRPQSVNLLGGYKVQREVETLLADSKAAEAAGAFAVVLECIPTPIAERITGELRIPTIGIGAGPHCDGQVLVVYDMLGLTSGYVPKFVKPYADVAGTISSAVRKFKQDVREGTFPGPEQSYK
jgi:3-methyl-2-oxobutanoate hydroxymethyltransferase